MPLAAIIIARMRSIRIISNYTISIISIVPGSIIISSSIHILRIINITTTTTTITITTITIIIIIIIIIITSISISPQRTS